MKPIGWGAWVALAAGVLAAAGGRTLAGGRSEPTGDPPRAVEDLREGEPVRASFPGNGSR
jgi:hypothetical protein